ncbi:MAG TPA: hypothetical protein VE646_01610 [Actinomycetota bacterium]|jgi:predicted transcriptional regulator|nr:hypothetical protein [Actinomycetota bacterium]
MNEIEEARHRLETDLRELEERLPPTLRSIKSLVGVLIGSASLGFVVRRLRSRGRSEPGPAAEVVVRIVREDRPQDG